jgi:nucleoid-associated protein YgaU
MIARPPRLTPPAGKPARQRPATQRRVRRSVLTLVRSLGALIVLIAVVIGVPVLLLTLMPTLHLTPRALPTLHQISTGLQRRDNGQLAAAVLLFGAWVCWALFTISLIPEIVAATQRRPARRLPGLGVLQNSAGTLVAAIVLGFTIAPLITGAAGAARGVPALPPLPSATAGHAQANGSSEDAGATVGTVSAQNTATTSRGGGGQGAISASDQVAGAARTSPTYEVQRRDTLWGIAERYLRDPLRYPEIAALNPTVVGPDNEIITGTILAMPADATGLPAVHVTAEQMPGGESALDTGPDSGGELNTGSTPATRTEASTGASREVTVQPGDTLWGIEQHVTGHGENWTQAWRANAARPEPDGETFTDPDWIRPGWTLTIPIPIPGPTAGPDVNSSPGPAVPSPSSPTTPELAPSPVPVVAPTTPTVSPTTVRADPPPTTTPSPTVPSLSSTTPRQAPAPASPQAPASRDAPAAVERSKSSRVPMTVFAGGAGLMLAGVALTALRGYRRRQARRRRPGRIIAATPPDLIGTERAVLTSGSAGIADVSWLDHALRSLVQTLADAPDARLPDVIAVCLSEDELTLFLTEPTPDAPPPWRVSEPGACWWIRRDDPLPYDPDRRGHYFAPYPALTSVGYTRTGEQWLLDLERVGALTVTGDPQRCQDLMRFLAAELAHNTWSEMLQVTLVGFGHELVPANPDRLTHTDDLTPAITDIGRQLGSLTAAETATDPASDEVTDVLTGRLHDIDGDRWATSVVLIASGQGAGSVGLDDLLVAMRDKHARVPIAVIVASHPDDPERGNPPHAPDPGDPPGPMPWQLIVNAAGRLSIPALGLDLIAQQLPADEAAQLAQILAHAATNDDQPTPTAHGDQPWDAHIDAGGMLTSPPSTADISRVSDVPAADGAGVRVESPQPLAALDSVLPLPTDEYLKRAATTAEDLRALAPAVDETVRSRIEVLDPDLDADLTQWHDPDCPRPRITLLGEVLVRAQGSLPERSPQRPFHTEIVAYLATRPRGVTSTVYAETMWPNDPDVVGKTKVRQSIFHVRKWLGHDPDTGADYLPSGLHEAAAARYRVTGALIDAELFRRLRARGLARGADGINDLWSALRLVQGPPFTDITQPREGVPGGYAWLADANFRLDHEYSAMIVDLAHTLATHHLAAGEPEAAASAAHVALIGGSYEDVPLLDLVQASLALNKITEAEAYVQQILSNYAVDDEEDLPPRTAEVLFRLRRRWAR